MRFGRHHAHAVCVRDPTGPPEVGAGRRKLLNDVLVAQHRTNHLLELARRAGFDAEELARST
jgi:hypothetical protein